MNHAAVSRLASVTVFALAVLGCDSTPVGPCTLPESLVGSNPQVLPVSEVDFEPGDASASTWVEIAQKAPSFAGIYIDGGDVVIQVADPADGPAAVEAVRRFYPSTFETWYKGMELRKREARVSVVKYTYLQLAHWEHAAIVNLANLGLTQGGVVVIGNGVDEKENEVKIEVRQNTCTTGIAGVLEEAGIPADAFRVEEGYPAGPGEPSRR